MYYQVLSISAPVFILVAIGFFISKINIDLNQKTIGFLLTHVGSPCLIFHTLSTTKPNINILMEIGFAAVLVTVFASIFSVLLLFITKDKISPYFSCLIHPNSANLALPLSILTYGDIGLLYAIPYYVFISFSQNTIGYAVILGTMNIIKFLYHPVLIMSLLGLFILIMKIPLYEPIITTTKFLGNIVIPLSLLLLGYSLTNVNIGNLKKAFMYSIARLIIGASSGLLTIFFLNLDSAKAGVVILMSIMPVAILNYIFSVQTDKDPETVGGLVVVSTLISLLILPLILGFVLHYFT
jgi:predicted permease